MNQELLDKLKKGDTTVLPIIYHDCFIIHNRPMPFWKRILYPNEQNDLQDHATEIANTMQAMNCKQLLRLRYQFSQSTSMEWYTDWTHVSPQSIRESVKTPKNYFYILALGTFHPNGYFREKCLDELKAYGGEALPYTLLLINNWVQPVREKAFEASVEIIQKASSLEIMRGLAFMEQLRLSDRRSKNHLEQLYSIVEKRLFHEEDFRISEIQTLDTYERRICYKTFSLAYLKRNITTLYKNEKDAFNRLQIAKRIIDVFHEQHLLMLFLADKFTPIRIKALESLAMNKDNTMLIKQFLFDSSSTIREYVRFLFRKEDIFDVVEEYRIQIRKQATVGGILGLGETGDESDIPQIKPFLSEENSTSIRKAAFIAMANIMKSDGEEFLCQHLSYVWSSKPAFRMIIARNYRFPCKRYYIDFLAIKNPAIQRRYLYLLIRGYTWDRLPWLIRLYPSLTPAQQNFISSHLLHKYNKVFTTPSACEQREILLAMQEAQLPPSLAQNITWMLQQNPYFTISTE